MFKIIYGLVIKHILNFLEMVIKKKKTAMRNANCFARQHYCPEVKSFCSELVCLGSNPASANCHIL